MGIFTLLKANIKYKKMAFISVVIMMVIISISVTAVLNIKSNYTKGIESALEEIHAGDLTVYLLNNKYSDAQLESVEDSQLVSSVKDIPAVFSENISAGDRTFDVSFFLLKLRDEYRIFSDDLTNYLDSTKKLNSGEIYVTIGLKTDTGIDVGDKLTVDTLGGKYQFTVKGFVAEPVTGNSAVDQKQVFISDEDFEKIYESNLKKETEDKSSILHLIQINKSDSCNLSDQQFRRELNIETGILNNSKNSITKSMSSQYATVIPDTLMSIFIVFNCILTVILLVFIGHNINTEIEMNYTDLGIIKSLGFTGRDIRLLYILLYITEQFFGMIIGLFLSVPVIKIFNNYFVSMTAILPQDEISFSESLLSLIIIIALSCFMIFLITRKIGMISPVRAISKGKSEIYFDSRLMLGIKKRALILSISLRNFMSNKKRYIGTMLIVAVLLFFMTSITALGNAFNSKSAIESMGGVYTECDVVFYDRTDDKTLEKIEKTIEQYSQINRTYYYNTKMFYLNGEEIHCTIYKDSEEIRNISLGRAPIYENEIVVTSIVAEELGLNIGDKVTVSKENKSADYIISGLFYSFINVGKDFVMPLIGAERLGIDYINCGNYSLGNPEQSEKIANALNNNFGDILVATNTYVSDNYGYDFIIPARILIYSLSVLICFLVINVVCSKAFMQEKIDIGIYKSIGFTSGKLRRQFAMRFLVVSLTGSILGVIFTFIFTKYFLLRLLEFAGITNIDINLSVFTVLVPIVIVCLSFFVFAYLVSYKVNNVDPKELVTE